MKLSISNIAWTSEKDKEMYSAMLAYGFSGLEIAPTRIFPEMPYQMQNEAKLWSSRLAETYSLKVSSIQSIWYGRTEKLFEDLNQQKILFDYTRSAIHFAQSIGCHNLVFGSPKNRCTYNSSDYQTGIAFFSELADYAYRHNTVIGLEANPKIYGTNYITTTQQALELVKEINCAGLKLNLDLGTMIANNEPAEIISGSVEMISHVHISEPHLQCIKRRPMHHEVLNILKQENYNGYISIEMARQDKPETILDVMEYIRSIVCSKPEV